MLSNRQASILTAALALAACIAGSAACGGDTTGQVVRFGLAAPLEQFIGSQSLRGAQLALERINAEGGILGRHLELAAVSDSANAGRALSVADQFFADESIIAVIGHSTSSATLAASSIYNRGLAAVSPTATSPDISGAGPWIFRVAPSDAANSGSLAEFAFRELGDRAAILYANEPYGRGLRDGFERAFAAEGGALLDQYPYIEGESVDFEPYLLGIRRADPDLIFIAGLDAGAGLIISQARALGIQAPIIGGDGLLGLAGRDAIYDGTYVGLLYHPDAPGQTGRQFVDAYRSAYGEPPDHFAALTYDAVRLVADAARHAGLDRVKLRDYLETIGNGRQPFPGVSGLIAFDQQGDPRQKSYAVGRIAGAKIELVSVEDGT
ncbi:MAG: ABC transporter substrate-binding protein [Gemmatimonadales bacterium]|jgi:branched-chain amino acid transport system substrate-binding protein